MIPESHWAFLVVLGSKKGSMSRLAVLAVCLAAYSHASVIVPPVGAPLPLKKAAWSKGTADPGVAVAPKFRSTKDRLPHYDQKFDDPRIFRGWTGEKFVPTGNNEATAYADLAENGGGDAPDALFKTLGIGYTGANPADSDIAVGPSYIVQVVNSQFTIFDKGGRVRYNANINEFIGDSQSIIANPHVIFDPWQQRWVQLWCSRRPTGFGQLVLIISDDADPLGQWAIYQFDALTGELDSAYPYNYDLGYGVNGLYAAGNQYRLRDNTFQEATLRTWNKAQVYNEQVGNMRTDELTTVGGQGTVVFAPRAAQLQATVGGMDGLFAAAVAGGGNRIYLWKLTDPFGAHTLTLTAVPTADYDMPVVGLQPGGTPIDTMDCRLLNCVVSSWQGSLYLFTGSQESNLWFGDTAPRAVNHFFVLNPVSGTSVWEGIFGLPNYSYWLSSAGVDMRGCATWAFARTGTGSVAYPELRYVDWNQGTFSGASKQVRFGESVFGGFGWGSYFESTMDWGDYQGEGTKAKTWVAGQVAPLQANTWATWLSTAAFDAVPGSIDASPSGDYFPIGPVGGPFSPASATYTLSNVGEVGVPFEVTGAPAWLTVDKTYGDIRGGGSASVVLSVNSAANGLEIASYPATITITNLFTGAVLTRNIVLSVQGDVGCSAVLVFEGSENDGGIAELAASDDTYYSFFNDSATLSASVVCFGYFPIRNPSRFTFAVEASIERAGLGVSVSMYNYQAQRFEVIGGGTASTVDSTTTSTVSVNPGRYINQTSRQVAAMLTWRPINDEAPSQDGWLHKIDYVNWHVVP